MNNTLSLIIFSFMASAAGYVFYRLYRKDPIDTKTANLSIYIISGMFIDGIFGLLVGLYILQSITVHSEGDIMWLVLSPLFFIVLMGLGGLVIGVRKRRKQI